MGTDFFWRPVPCAWLLVLCTWLLMLQPGGLQREARQRCGLNCPKSYVLDICDGCERSVVRGWREAQQRRRTPSLPASAFTPLARPGKPGYYASGICIRAGSGAIPIAAVVARTRHIRNWVHPSLDCILTHWRASQPFLLRARGQHIAMLRQTTRLARATQPMRAFAATPKQNNAMRGPIGWGALAVTGAAGCGLAYYYEVEKTRRQEQAAKKQTTC